MSDIIDALRYAEKQAFNEAIDIENRILYIEDIIALKGALAVIKQRFGNPDPDHHWFWRQDWKEKEQIMDERDEFGDLS